jgi:hypothetical protein
VPVLHAVLSFGRLQSYVIVFPLGLHWSYVSTPCSTDASLMIDVRRSDDPNILLYYEE